MRTLLSTNFKRKVAQNLDLPPAVVLDCATIQLVGDREAKITNHKGLVHYNTQSIKAKATQGLIEVQGDDLEIVSFSSHEISIVGNIRQVILK